MRTFDVTFVIPVSRTDSLLCVAECLKLSLNLSTLRKNTLSLITMDVSTK